MEGTVVELLEDVNPNNRGYDWYMKYITVLRMLSRPLFDPIRVRENKKIILSEQSMEKTKEGFKDKDFKKNTKFIPLGIWSRMLNLIVEELTKAPPQCELNATDSQALSDKKSDILLLKQKHILENDLNTIGAKVGDPPTIVGKDKFKGNIDEFERLGLDPNDPDDIAFYEQSGFQRLKYEIAGQSLINNIMKLNRFDEDTIRKFVIDILAILGICMQAYVDQITGEIRYRYIFPEEAWGIFGDAEDGSDDICQGYQRASTVREWIGMVGNSFDWDRDWRKLLSGINYYTGNKYTGFKRYRNNYECFGNQDWCREGNCIDAPTTNLVDWQQALLFKVYTGYIEWNTVDATATYLQNKLTEQLIGGLIDYDIDLGSAVNVTNTYDKENFYQEQMYKSYYLATGFSSQFIYNYGKVYYQQLEGAFDERSKGTLKFYRLEGISAAEISEPVIDICNQSFYRMKWLLSKVKPPDDEYSFDELIQMSKGFKKEFIQNGKNINTATPQGMIEDLIQYQRENSVKIRFYPQVEGKVIPQIPSFPEKRSAEEFLATQMQVTINWGETWIAQKIGLNDIRLGQQENDRQGFRAGMQETQASLNSTGYIYRIIQYLKQHVATITCNYAQDIIRFQDTIPYNYLKKLLGEDDFENLKLLGNFAQHRYGIFIDDYNTTLNKQMLMDAANKALDSGDGRGGITIGQWGVLMMQPDYKKGLRLLDFYKYKEAKKLRAQQIQDAQIAQNNALQLEKAKQQTIQLQGQLAITKEQVAADGYKYAADKQYQSKVDVKQIGIGAETQKIVQKTAAEKEIAENKATIELEKSLTP